MLLSAVILLVTGCWDAINIIDQSFITMVILDKQGEEFTFIIEIPKITPAGSNGGTKGPKVTFVKGSGSSFVKARDSLDEKVDKPLYLGTTRTLIITENASKNDLPEYLFRLREDFTYRQKIILTTTREDPAILTEAENENETPSGYSIDDNLISLNNSGLTFAKTTASYVEDILSNRGFVVHCIGLENKQLTLVGYSVFRDGKNIGFIPVENARGLVFMLAQKPAFFYRVPYGEEHATVEVELTQKKIVPSYQDGTIRFSVQIKFKGDVQYFSQVALFPLDEQKMKEIKLNLTQVLQEEIQKTIDQSQKEFQSDYLMFCESLRLAYPEVYDKLDFGQVYPNVQIEVSTSLDVSISPKMDYDPS